MFKEELDEWFDIYSLTDPAAREELQVEGLHDSIKFLRNVLTEKARIIGHERIILMGLSQGCATGKCSLRHYPAIIAQQWPFFESYSTHIV